MLAIDHERFLRVLFEQGKIGWQEGRGLSREAYSEHYYEVRDYIEEVMKDAGLTTRVDMVGNLFGRLEGKDPTAPVILTGSHLDAVSNGGIYDGPLGVVAGIEALQSIREQGIEHNHPYEVAAFNAEEAGPLGGTFGSRAFSGQLKSLPDADTLSPFGLTAEAIEQAKADMSRYAAYLELHVEQGPVLWKRNVSIGIPTGIVGITRYRTVISGKQNHAGTTPMAEREDAMYEAVELLHRWMSSMRNREDCVFNVGTFQLEPGHIGIVPGRVSFDLEIRALDQTVSDEAVRDFEECLSGLTSCKGETKQLVRKPPVHLSEEMITAVEEASRRRGVESLRMTSGASHDASPMALAVPTGMIFVPSVRGVSHAKEEHTERKDLLRGAELVSEALMELDTRFD